MSAASLLRARAPRRTVGLPAVVAATVVAVAGGVAIGLLADTDRDDPRPPAAPQSQFGLRSGVARLPLPVGWRPLGTRSSIPGFERATAVRGEHGPVALDLRAPEQPSLLPAGVPGSLPTTRRLGGRTVWRYDLLRAQDGLRLFALVLPTTGGVVTIACASRLAAARAAASGCERAAQAVQLEGAAALAPAPETAAAIVLPSAAARLNRSRVAERRRLAATRSPRLRAAAAGRLARAYADAARRLRPVAAGDAARMVRTLTALSGRHRALATATRRRYPAPARRAGAAIRREERRLAALIAATQREARAVSAR
jgi:hypothetical protein